MEIFEPLFVTTISDYLHFRLCFAYPELYRLLGCTEKLKNNATHVFLPNTQYMGIFLRSGIFCAVRDGVLALPAFGGRASALGHADIMLPGL